MASAPDRRWQRAALFLACAEQLMTISMPVSADPVCGACGAGRWCRRGSGVKKV